MTAEYLFEFPLYTAFVGKSKNLNWVHLPLRPCKNYSACIYTYRCLYTKSKPMPPGIVWTPVLHCLKQRQELTKTSDSESKFHILTTAGRQEPPRKPLSTNFGRFPKMQKYEYHPSKGWKGIDSIPCRTAPAQYFVASKRAFHKNIQLP